MINLKCKSLLFCTSVLGRKKISVLNNFKNMKLFNNNNSSSYVFNFYYKNLEAVGNSVNSLIQLGTNRCSKVMPLFKNRTSNIIICQKCNSFSPQSKIFLQRPQPPTFSSFSLKSSNFCGSPLFNLFYKSKQLPCYYFRVNRRCFHKSSNTYNSVKVNSKNSKIVINVKNIKKKRFASSAGKEMKRLFVLAKKEKWKLTGAILLLLISSSITMAIPFSLGKVIDLIYAADQSEMKKNLNTLSLVLISIFLLGGLCNFGRVYLMNVCGHRITKDLRQKVFLSIIQQETAFFDKNKTGELINRLSADTALVGQCVTLNISDGLRSLVMAGAGASMMFYVSSELACVGLAIVPPVAVIAIMYGRFVRKITKAVQDALAESTQVAEERISNVRTVKSFSHEKEEIAMYNSRMEDVFALAAKESFARGLFYGLTGLSGNVIILTVLYYGVSLVGHDEFTVGSLSAFLFYAAYVGISLSGLSSFYAEMNKGLGASSRLWEIIDRVPAISTSGGLVLSDPLVGDITFQNVVFSYPSRPDCSILNELNLSVKSGSVTAVVGPSGSGKSTLASLIIRLYDPQSGVVLVDGLPVSTYDPVWLRSFIGTVSQEPVLFSGSIRDNIAYGASDPSSVNMESIEMAAVEANAFDFITRDFPEGFNTRVGERGIMLSGGQKQRVAIARALVKNPRILLLDEATSALDAESEHLVQEALERIMKGRTVLTIAHRLSTIKNADQIAVLRDGKVVQLGTYDKLMNEENGAFRKLVQHQTFHNVGHIQSRHCLPPSVKPFQDETSVIL